MSFGERVTYLRKKKDLRGCQLAKRLKLSAAFVSQVENGKKYPSTAVLKELKEILGDEMLYTLYFKEHHSDIMAFVGKNLVLMDSKMNRSISKSISTSRKSK